MPGRPDREGGPGLKRAWARRHGEDRQAGGLGRRAKAGKHGKSVKSRKSEIEEHGPVTALPCGLEHLPPVGPHFDGEALPAQESGQRVCDEFVVLAYEDASPY